MECLAFVCGLSAVILSSNGTLLVHIMKPTPLKSGMPNFAIAQLLRAHSTWRRVIGRGWRFWRSSADFRIQTYKECNVKNIITAQLHCAHPSWRLATGRGCRVWRSSADFRIET
ncbi:uncharacterized protein LOC107040008 [Diachasma alloeum]|uniref:uncharacterized protein LOC107040008 n=1 Tax=Diachasma alloeum TaxID=454923 RepID=UPI0007383876|nr:uncharacterized protein LOC107040008 [Diachasma alloeum]